MDDLGLGADRRLLPDLWNEKTAAAMSEPELLLYRSNLLGADKRITNFGGGNTSAKVPMKDPLTGENVTVLWVKGSGGDLGSMKMDGLSTLYLDKLRLLEARFKGPESEDIMPGLYPHCTFNLNPRAASIDTPLHGFMDYKHIDHMHPDAVIAIAAAKDSQKLTHEIYGDDIGWLPWLRPGFELGLRLRDFAKANPSAKGVILEAHGLFTWANSSHECYETTLAVINKAILWLSERSTAEKAFGKQRVKPLEREARRAIAAKVMPPIRGMMSEKSHKIGHFNDSQEVLDFVCSERLQELADLGTSCPDHFLRTKIRPLVHKFDPATETAEALVARIAPSVAAYREDYAAYYNRCKRPTSPPMRDANAVVHLIPGVGMLTFAADKATARIAGEFYVNAINVMRGAASVSTYAGLPEQEAFDIEYWLLEEAKLQRMPKPKALAGRVAIITGGAGGIGSATARRLLDEGACVLLCDIDKAALTDAEDQLTKSYGTDVVKSAVADVTDEKAIAALYEDAAVYFGGTDICVSNAGLASASPVEDTSLDLWNKNMNVLSTGYFLFSREAFRQMKAQAMGGSIVFIGSKNGLAASAGATAYCTAKASELHLARCLALEGAATGIRVNVVNPDAVLKGSRIWQGEWASQRAAQNKTTVEDLEKVYRERSLLKRSVYPEDIAEAVAFLASERSAKSTGNIINVDAGNAAAFTR